MDHHRTKRSSEREPADSLRDKSNVIGGWLPSLTFALDEFTYAMKCFYHPTVDAVATCKSCCRALCRDCIAEVGLSCSCRSRCEADVATLNELIERGRTAYQKTSATYFRSGIFVSLLGMIFVLLGAVGVSSSEHSEWSYFLLFIGIVFTGWGISHFVSAKRMSQR